MRNMPSIDSGQNRSSASQAGWLRSETPMASTNVEAIAMPTANASNLSAPRAKRERLVLGREDDRRRIRRDLHDGLGPAELGGRCEVVCPEPGGTTVRAVLPYGAATGTPSATSSTSRTDPVRSTR